MQKLFLQHKCDTFETLLPDNRAFTLRGSLHGCFAGTPNPPGIGKLKQSSLNTVCFGLLAPHLTLACLSG